MVNLEPEFYQKLVKMTHELNMKPEDLLVVMFIESGLKPGAHNKNGDASGLVQFMPSTLKGLGFKGTHEDFRQLSAVNQLDYVKKMIQGGIGLNGGPFTSAAQYYISNFIPAALKIPGVKQNNPDTVVAAQNPEHADIPGVSERMERIYYLSNKGLDVDKDKVITVGDIQTLINNMKKSSAFKQVLSDLNQATGYTPQKDTSKLKLVQSPEPSLDDKMDKVIDYYYQLAVAANKKQQNLYKQYLPNQNIMIEVLSNNYVEGTEFARILCLALQEELSAKTEICSKDNQIQINCNLLGSNKLCLGAVEQLSNALEDIFYEATKKIGGIEVFTKCFMDKKSSYQRMSLETNLSNHRKFLLKFV